jgi:N-acetylglucosamine-6-phosphate deacetylase
MIDRVRGRNTLEGVVVDPIEGSFPGALVIEGGVIVEVRRGEGGASGPLLFPGFVDLQVYDAAAVAGTGVTGYLLATRTVQEVADPLCLGLHLEGPFLNPEAAGAIPVDELTPVDLGAVREWAEAHELVRLVTLAPELPLALVAVERLAAAGIVAAVGHTQANDLTAQAALDAGASFATHLWNAMKPPRARSPGPVLTLLLDERVTIGLIPDGRHLHPLVEALAVCAAGPGRVALTSDVVPAPQHRLDGSLLGGDKIGAAVVKRMARFGLAEAAMMASLVPAQVLGLTDRGRLAPGYRADLAVLAPDFTPLRTLVAGEDL